MSKRFLIDKYLPRIVKKLKNRDNYEFVDNLINSEMNNKTNMPALVKPLPIDPIYIDDKKLYGLYEYFDIIRFDFEKDILVSDINVKSGEKGSAVIRNSYYILFPFIILAMEKCKYPRPMISKMVTFFGVVNYRTAQMKFMSVGGHGLIWLDEGILKRAINNTSGRYKLRQVKNIYLNIKYTAEYYYFGKPISDDIKHIKKEKDGDKGGLGIANVKKCEDLSLLRFRQDMRTRIISPLRSLRGIYEELRENKEYINSTHDIATSDGIIRQESMGSVSADLKAHADLVFSKLVYEEISVKTLNRTKTYISDPRISSEKTPVSLLNNLTKLVMLIYSEVINSSSERENFRELVYDIFIVYNSKFGNYDSRTLTFVLNADSRIYGTSNTKDERIIFIKNTINRWLNTYSEKYRANTRGGTEALYKKFLFSAICLNIVYVSPD